MEKKIQILSEELVGKISAGEVVERPASVVKELVENSIDAGANNIDIEIQSAGISLIRIADNGEGISNENSKLACRQHATSKLKKIEDLNSLYTLGFRGEALASITSVAQTDIITKSDTDENGIYMYLESGEILKSRPVGRARGTTIEVRNLFYNVPARRKFLKKESTELSEIVSTVGRFIVSWPNIEFKLSHDGKCLLRATKDMDVKERLKLILGENVVENMFQIKNQDSNFEIFGYVSRPSWTRNDKRGQMFFLNNRFIKSKSISESLSSAFWSMLERGRYPLAVIFLKTPADSVDVNVHPAKLHVKFENENMVKEFIKNTVKNSFELLKSDEKHLITVSQKEEYELKEPSIIGKPLGGTEDLQNEFKYDFKTVGQEVVDIVRNPRGLIKSELNKYLTNSIFQIGNCYIVQLVDKGLKITDQHAAHERILYEFFSRVLNEGVVETQNLLFPVRLDLSLSEKVLMKKIIPDFKRIGFTIEEFGSNSFVVQVVPAIINDSDIKTVIMDIFEDLKDYDLTKINIVNELIKRTACRAAIKSGDSLTKEEMLSLLEQLSNCSLPFTCPHGRPTMLDITIDELEKRFHRK